MNITEFQDRVDAYGADLAAWPDDERRAAEGLVAADPAARGCLDEALRLDALFARGRNDAANDASAARVLAAMRGPLPRQRRFALSWAWPAALLDVDLAPARLRIAALAGVAVLGIVIGLMGPDIGDAGSASASAETTIAAVFEPEPLSGELP